MKYCYDINIKNIFLICLITQIVLYAEDIYVSSETVTSQEEIQTPFFFKFYSLPEDFSPPVSVEYEDIIMPYKYILSPEIEKINLTKMFFLSQKEINNLNLFLGENNSVSLITKNIYENKNFEFTLKFNNIKISYFTEDKQFVKFDANFIYKQSFDSMIFSSRIKTFSNYISKFINQYYIDAIIKKVVVSRIEFSFMPQLIWYNNEDYNKLFLIDMFNINFLIKNFIFIFEGKFYKFDNMENFTTTIRSLSKDLIISGGSINISTSWDKDNNLYYELEVGQQTQNFEFGIAKKKRFYYEYIEDYFIKLPYIRIDSTETFCFPTFENLSCKCKYKSKNCNISILFDKSVYTKYPTYVFQDNNVITLFTNNTEISAIEFETQIFFVDFRTKYLLSNDILFYPKISSQICVTKDIFKNIYFLIKLLYNSKTKITSELYIDENFISEYKIGYKLREKFNIELFVSLPLNNNYILQPHMVVKPYIQVGLNFQF